MLSVKNVSKIYHLGNVEVRALDDVSFEVATGTMMCIMGKSGSGKSTLLRQLSLIDKPNTGTIHFDKIEVTTLSEVKRTTLRLERLGYVFQEYALIPELTAQENVYLPGMMLGRKGVDYRAKAKELLTLVGLGERIKHLPKELSGGQQQRVAIARALINEPDIIYADEPTANLDSISAKTVMDTLQKLNSELKVTVIFVSHDPDDQKYAKKLLFLKDGKLTDEDVA